MRCSFWRDVFIGAVTAGLIAVLAWPATAQGRFEPVLRVNERIVTRYELDERTRFLALLRAPGDPRDIARQQLVNEAIQRGAAEAFGIELSEEGLRAGLEEFAGRANLTADEFVTALQQNGVSAETFRDFVGAGVMWRDYVRARFAEDARDIPRSQISRTLTQLGTEGGLRVLLSEILLPATTPETAAASRARAVELSSITDEAAFAAAARQFSVAGSRARGGALNWVAVDTLPPDVGRAVSDLTPGRTSRPIELENAIGLYFLREAERIAAGTPEALDVDYALFITDGSDGAADRVLARVDDCDDFYGVALGLPEDRLIRETRPAAALPADVATAIVDLDAEETAVITRSGLPAVLMLCGRAPDAESTVDFEIVGTRLLNQRLGAMSAHHLAELRAAAFVEDLSN